MQENEFERKLQQKLETLQVQPAEEVWQRVKEQVAQKKKKRRMVFFFLFFTMVIVGISATMLLWDKPTNEGSGVTAKTIQATNKDTSGGVITETHTRKKDGANLHCADKTPVTDVSTTNSVYSAVQINGNSTTRISAIDNKDMGTGEKLTNDRTSSAAFNAKKIKTSGRTKTTTGIPTVEDSRKDDNTSTYVVEQEVNLPDPITRREPGSDTNSPNVDSNAINTTTVKEKELIAAEKTTTLVNPGSTTKKEKKQSNGRKWGIGFSVAGGLNFVNNPSSLRAFSQDYNGGGIGNNPGSPASGSSFMPSPFRRGVGMAAGVHVYRQVSRSVSITAGIQYTFNTLGINTGNRFDSTGLGGLAYRYGSSESYTNRYHYLTIPVSISVKLFSIGNKEVLFDAGGSISKLLKSNALAFNNVQGTYLAQKNELNTTVFSLSASTAINVAGDKRPALFIGPQLNYMLSPLAQKGLHSGRHAVFAGIKIQKNLWR